MINEVNIIDQLAEEACKFMHPLYELRDFIAVNPFVGYSNYDFIEAYNYIKYSTGVSILPNGKTLLKLYSENKFTSYDISHSLDINSSKDIKESSNNFDIKDIIHYAASKNYKDENYQKIYSFAKLKDLNETQYSLWEKDIALDISRFMQIRYDRSVSRMQYQNESITIIEAWFDYAKNSFGMQARGLRNFKKYLNNFNYDTESIIKTIVSELNFKNNTDILLYFTTLLYEIKGWAGYLNKLNFHSKSEKHSIKDILAIRLIYDFVLLKEEKSFKTIASFKNQNVKECKLSNYEYACYILFQALENAKEKEYMHKLIRNNEISYLEKNLLAQVVFCIDVRSEIIRRHISKSFSDIECYGFAGFFGLPISVKNEKNENEPNCPVLLEPSHETQVKIQNSFTEKLKKDLKNMVKLYSKTGTSCFSFVETIGFYDLISIIKKLLKRPIITTVSSNNPIEFTNISKGEKVNFAKGIIKNLNLNKPYGKYIVFCGHESSSANNPLIAGLNCGACAGHSGSNNAKAAALLLNDKEVRSELKSTDFEIPDSSIFIPAVHNTMTDEIRFLTKLNNETRELQNKLNTASEKTRKERAEKLNFKNKTNLLSKLKKRSYDISETMPEWALANNNSFIVANTKLIRELNFEGKSFLHNYIPENDKDGTTLELILTAPAIVTSWINLQYFGSSVTPDIFGSGNKTIHNVSSGIGVLNGNDGDLELGLAKQSVRNDEELQHEPVRLHILIQSDIKRINDILCKHDSVNNLVKNSWIKLFSLGEKANQFYQCIERNNWINKFK